ncbi:MAG TPA: NAD(P)-binding domain-containing protein [Acidimicrobiales bacterium]|nr:NAD(P)-binding domain-containing protein [Acidimicrobiales bacterium]
MTTVAVLGAGNIGATLAGKWAAAGHTVVIGTRDPSSEGVHARADRLGAGIATHADAVAGADVVLFALPGSAMEEATAALGHVLDGKIVIDATNSLGGQVMNSVGVITAHAPGAKVARAFNSIGWENFDDPDFNGIVADLLWCGPDGDAAEVVEQLISDVGLRPVRVGGLDQLATVDTVASLWFALALGQGYGRQLAFKVLTRDGAGALDE